MGTRIRMTGLLLFAATAPALGVERNAREVGERLDAAVAAAIGGQGLAPAVDDATFLRRVWLDLAGRVPPALTARDFLEDRDPQKRVKMVDRLLDSDDFAGHWADVLAGWVLAERPIKRDGYDGRVLRAYLKDGLRRGTPYGKLVRDLLTGAGASDSSGPTNFLLRYDADPARLAGAVGKSFLGVTIQCAQCHDHPFTAWKQDDFWGLAAAFARLRKLEASGDDDLKAVLEARRGELTRPAPQDDKADVDKDKDAPEGDEGEPKRPTVAPRLPGGKAVPPDDRRQALADWVVARDNPYFARNLVNLLWRELFGHGLVPNLDPRDAKAETSPVLDLLAQDASATGHDLKALLRVVVLSRSYAQGSAAHVKPAWARPAPRPLSVDQLFASVAQATGYDGPSPEPPEGEDAPEEEGGEPDASRCPDPKDAEKTAPAADESEEEGSDRPVEMLGDRALTLQRALVMANGEFVHEACRFGSGVAFATSGRADDASRLDWAFLATLSRRPTQAERAALRPLLETRDRKGGFEDVFWVLLNSAEFQTNH